MNLAERISNLFVQRTGGNEPFTVGGNGFPVVYPDHMMHGPSEKTGKPEHPAPKAAQRTNTSTDVKRS